MKLRTATLEDARAIAALERESYPPDEAASLEQFQFRLRVAPALCRVGTDTGGAIVGFVCGTAVPGEHLTQESMHEHDPAGASVCIHSVVVETSRRRRGVGLELLRDYHEHVVDLGAPFERIVLICKAHLIDFYASAGFTMVGPSPVAHGVDSWFEMVQPLR